MKATTVRRTWQVVFLILFLWLCIVSTVGDKFYQIRNWPINLFLYLDPLTGFATALTTHTLWYPLVLSAVVIAITVVFGRVFCGWICPFGTIHHFVGFFGQKFRPRKMQVEKGRYHKLQNVKYLVLAVFIGLTSFGVGASILQTGVLAPIPLLTRTVSNVLLPILDSRSSITMATNRYYEGAVFIFVIFAVLTLLNLYIPRFFCRFLCPSGALLGLVNRFKLFDFIRSKEKCTGCLDCTVACTSGCNPQGKLRSSECVMCFNCRQVCPEEAMTFGCESLGANLVAPDISRRGFALSLAGGIVATKAFALADTAGENYNNKLIRPPGAMPEEEFQRRCIKCGQCIRVCPTNVLQPASIHLGFVNMWTPVMNNRIGTSGCQMKCVACSQVCPTAAIRPITLEEKYGTGEFADKGPIKTGTAFVDRNRCLPWAMAKPCIVCEENCPLSPKAIRTAEVYQQLGYINVIIRFIEGEIVTADIDTDINIATGDYYLRLGENRYKIINRIGSVLTLGRAVEQADRDAAVKPLILVHLQRPIVDINKCIGCGTCEHECPVSGKRAIRISAEGETRDPSNRLLLE